jgi:hypothetical protein
MSPTHAGTALLTANWRQVLGHRPCVLAVRGAGFETALDLAAQPFLTHQAGDAFVADGVSTGTQRMHHPRAPIRPAGYRHGSYADPPGRRRPDPGVEPIGDEGDRRSRRPRPPAPGTGASAENEPVHERRRRTSLGLLGEERRRFFLNLALHLERGILRAQLFQLALQVTDGGASGRA